MWIRSGQDIYLLGSYADGVSSIVLKGSKLTISGAFYENVVLLAKTLTLSQSKNIFGFSESYVTSFSYTRLVL